jgi:hypothetical protein
MLKNVMLVVVGYLWIPIILAVAFYVYGYFTGTTFWGDEWWNALKKLFGL